jgi:hypothetical protein
MLDLRCGRMNRIRWAYAPDRCQHCTRKVAAILAGAYCDEAGVRLDTLNRRGLSALEAFIFA